MPTQPTKSLTPETDEKQYSIQQLEQFGIKYPFNTLILCSASFARSLELRLNAALAENEELYTFINREMKMTASDPRIKQLEQAIDAAIQSTNKRNLNQKEKE